MKPKTTPIARLTITYQSGRREAVEIHADSSFHAFYHWYLYTSKVKKTLISTRSRTWYGQISYTSQAGLPDVLIAVGKSFRTHKDPITSSKIVIYKKRLYKKFMSLPADELPGGLPKVVHMDDRRINKITHEDRIRVEYLRKRQGYVMGWSKTPQPQEQK